MKVATVFALLLVSANAFTAPQFATRAVGAPKKAAPKKKVAAKKPVMTKIKSAKVCRIELSRSWDPISEYSLCPVTAYAAGVFSFSQCAIFLSIPLCFHRKTRNLLSA